MMKFVVYLFICGIWSAKFKITKKKQRNIEKVITLSKLFVLRVKILFFFFFNIFIYSKDHLLQYVGVGIHPFFKEGMND